MDKTKILELLDTYKSILISLATGGSISDKEYVNMRNQILDIPELRDKLPPFIRLNRKPIDFFRYMQSQSSTYQMRREIINEGMAQLTEYIEFQYDDLAEDANEHKNGATPNQNQTILKRMEEANNDERIRDDQKSLIFISHSSKDKEYAIAFVDLLFAIGLNDKSIVCSSYPGCGIPLGKGVYDWLVTKFQECDLYVLYFLSHNYYQSAVCLNEMGAAWAMKQKWKGILLPGFTFSEIQGCIDSRQIGIKLDGDINELKHRLGELKDDVVEEFGLKPINATRWEKVRDEFIQRVDTIVEANQKSGEEQSDNNEVAVIAKEEKNKYDLATKGIIELDETDDVDKQLLDAIESLGWSDEVIVP